MASWNVNPFSDAFPGDGRHGEFSVSCLTLPEGNGVTKDTTWRCEVKTRIYVDKSDCNATVL